MKKKVQFAIFLFIYASNLFSLSMLTDFIHMFICMHRHIAIEHSMMIMLKIDYHIHDDIEYYILRRLFKTFSMNQLRRDNILSRRCLEGNLSKHYFFSCNGIAMTQLFIIKLKM
jgi:hypothetical protein